MLTKINKLLSGYKHEYKQNHAQEQQTQNSGYLWGKKEEKEGDKEQTGTQEVFQL